MTETKTFANIITDFESAYRDFITVAETYPVALQTQAGVCGTWSVREVVAHLCGWIVEAHRRYPRYALGTGNMQYNTDAFNEVSVWLRREKDFSDMLDELRRVSGQLTEMARELPEAQITRETRYAEWLTNLTREAHEHRIQLQSFLEGQT